MLKTAKNRTFPLFQLAQKCHNLAYALRVNRIQSKYNRILVPIAGISLVIFIAILILELIFGSWFTNDDGWNKTKQLNIIREREIIYDVSNLYSASKSTVIYTRDRFGLRSTCENSNESDILAVGGSTTDQRYITDEETWTSVLQDNLNTKISLSDSLCVANSGVDGHSTYGHLESFRLWFPLIPELKPKIVLLYVGVNDAGLRFAPIPNYDFTENVQNNDDRSFRRTWRERSAFIQLFNLLKSGYRTNLSQFEEAYAGHSRVELIDEIYSESQGFRTDDIKFQTNAIEFEKRLNDLLDMIELKNGTTVCISQPHKFTKQLYGQERGIAKVFTYDGKNYNGLDYDFSINKLNEVMESVCSMRNNAYFFDLAKEEFTDDEFYDFVHMTPEGANHVGKSISNFILNESSLLKILGPK